MEPSRKPLNLLIRKMNGDVAVKLKNDTEYRGKMIDCDSHMNIILDGAREYRDGDPATNYASLLVTGSNGLYICFSQPTTYPSLSYPASRQVKTRLRKAPSSYT